VIAQSNDGSALPRPGDPDAGGVSGPAQPDSVRVQRLLGRYSRCGDPGARDELVRRFLPLAQRYHPGPEPLDDLAQIASIGVPNLDRLRRVLQHMQTVAAGTDRREVSGPPRERAKNGRPSIGPSPKSLPQEFISCTSSLP
jgi:hypothetical protein